MRVGSAVAAAAEIHRQRRGNGQRVQSLWRFEFHHKPVGNGSAFLHGCRDLPTISPSGQTLHQYLRSVMFGQSGWISAYCYCRCTSKLICLPVHSLCAYRLVTMPPARTISSKPRKNFPALHRLTSPLYSHDTQQENVIGTSSLIWRR